MAVGKEFLIFGLLHTVVTVIAYVVAWFVWYWTVWIPVIFSGAFVGRTWRIFRIVYGSTSDAPRPLAFVIYILWVLMLALTVATVILFQLVIYNGGSPGLFFFLFWATFVTDLLMGVFWIILFFKTRNLAEDVAYPPLMGSQQQQQPVVYVYPAGSQPPAYGQPAYGQPPAYGSPQPGQTGQTPYYS